MKPHIKERLKNISSKETQLDLQSGRLSIFPTDILICENLRSLNLSDNSISSLPDELYKLIKLENLTISKNNFQEISSSLFLLPVLRSLSAKNNKIKTVPGQIWQLQKIDLSENQIDRFIIPKEPFTYDAEEVNLRNNNLKTFPLPLKKCIKLKKLNLSYNALSSLKDSDLDSLSNLEELDLSHNQLTFLPSKISKLSKLKILNLTGNKLKNLPPEIASLESLEKLEIVGNPMPNAPIEIEAQGMKALINYYLSLNETIKLFEAKLLIVGQGDVGKTILMNRLVFNKTPATKSTEGIKIVQWVTQTPASDEFRINVWDFGGQEIYHSTHQFFLTKRSLYLFVWVARSDRATTFDYWLNIIKLLSQESPTIMVLNKIDERIQMVDEISLSNKFNNVKSFYQISALYGTNTEELTRAIQKHISELPLVGNVLPKVWLDIRKELENLNKNFISFKEYLQICNNHSLDEKKALFLSQYFHDLGVFLHFQEDAILKSIVFLAPEWATNAVYRLIDAKLIIKNYGEFYLGELEDILDEYPSENHLQLVRLMEKFELCFKLLDKQDHYLIPELLNPTKPYFDDQFKEGLKFEYRYDFMPAGILARCIVRNRALIGNKKFWKFGVVLERDDAKVLIESDEIAKKIRITSIGEDRATLLQVIQRDFEEIHQTLNYPNVPSWIPCICNACQNSNNPHFFKYDFLQRATKSNIKTHLCENSIQGVNIENILSQYRLIAQPLGRQIIESERLKSDLVEVCSILLERKHTEKENTQNDKIVDLLRAKGYYVADQTRSGVSGLSGTDSGSLDIMVRGSDNIPLAIIESLRVDSCGDENKTIAQHISKLLGDYDTNGLKRNFIIVFGEASKFSKLWENYGSYIMKINNNQNFSYREEFPLIHFDRESKATSHTTNIKIGIARHQKGDEEIEVVHAVLNMKR